MLPPDAAPLLYREITRIADHPEWPAREQALALANLLERLFYEVTRQEQIAFSTLFARICYAGHLHNIQPDTLRLIHLFRWTARRIRDGYAADEQAAALGVRATAEAVLVLTQAPMPQALAARCAATPLSPAEAEGELTFAASARVVVLKDDPEQQCLIAIDEANPGRPVRVRYNLSDRNDNFNPTIQVIRRVFGFPVSLQLLEVDLDAAGDYRPRAIVVEPDYLVDVSAISECFKENGAEPFYHLVRKYLPGEVTPPILLGNIANYFLDRLLHEPDVAYPDLLRETFRQFPFVYAPMSDREVKELAGKAQKHYLNLKQMALEGFAKQGIAPEGCVLEPTFFSRHYGIQGRLDLFFQNEEKSAIVELKSGTPFKPNSYGIQRSHFTQTLLYDLLVRSVFGAQADPAKYILYSAADVQPLRFAPTVVPEQWEALQLRNQLVAIERLLTKIRPGEELPAVMARVQAAKAGPGFLKTNFSQFETAYSGLSATERKYFNAFTGFIAREHWLAKVGDDDAETVNGNAALWRNSFAEKQQAFAILSHLEIEENGANQSEPFLRFRKTGPTNPLANFRVGDIGVLYPAQTDSDTVLDYQVIKCTVTELGKDHVCVQLRYRQNNPAVFETEGLWNIEPDFMDMGFTGMYRGLFEWAGAAKEKRTLLLAGRPPEEYPTPGPSPEGRGALTRSPDVAPPLPSGEGSGVGLFNVGAYGDPEVTTDLARWKYLKEFARTHRREQTPAEATLWQHLRSKRLLGTKFRRQHAIEDFIVDFVCLELRLVVEVDGGYHDHQSEHDELRTEFLQCYGFETIRFKNEEVEENTEGVLTKLKSALENRRTALNNPSPEGLGRHDHAASRQGTPPLGGGAGGGVLTPEQQLVFQKIIQSRDYFLLWGPPGTGKTSVMLRALADWVLTQTDDNLLLLAYTNRAVDEICEALDSLGEYIRETYLRIGSRFSTAPRFREQLLNHKIAGAANRNELREVLGKHRIFVSTVASFAQNEGLLKLKKFQRLVVDEASQLLEPQVIGLLSRFDHFVLIGDHRQLPAVSAQRAETTAVEDADLRALGLTDLRDSYFERLYRRCESEGWHWAYARLSHQGRMHQDIMEFPNRHFYGGFLQTLPSANGAEGLEEKAGTQHVPLWYDLPGAEPFWEKIFSEKRVVFLPTPPEETLPGQKTNRAEAELVARLVVFFKKLFALNDQPWRPHQTLGIITPWRAQIAQLRSSLAALELEPDELTIDTVERYQGGARDVIIISCCVNSESQLASLVSLSTEGVDRKLNVALTRARQHVVVVGNAGVLQRDERYRAFIERYAVPEPVEEALV